MTTPHITFSMDPETAISALRALFAQNKALTQRPNPKATKLDIKIQGIEFLHMIQWLSAEMGIKEAIICPPIRLETRVQKPEKPCARTTFTHITLQTLATKNVRGKREALRKNVITEQDIRAILDHAIAAKTATDDAEAKAHHAAMQRVANEMKTRLWDKTP